ncbi:MAG: leucine--tRNA ligase [Cytophagales bacterium]|nr:leucine--tRNA ligase [Cytophagales bacterium]
MQENQVPHQVSTEPEAFHPASIEAAAQANWNARDAYRVAEQSDKPLGKFYACSMLPYPSGKLHMGHVRNYTINDMLTRQLRMKGYNVLMPMGWDAFGLPAENAAMKNGVPPAAWTYSNIAYMKKQMQAMGLAIDWSREVATCDPSYYKWNQWFFLKMLKAGIAYRKTQIVNWDPVDMTVLANEQVIDGRGWRTGAVVEKREIPGYYLNITKYAPELLEHVQTGLAGWPERVRLMQENWIGQSEGVRFAFTHEIKDASGELIQGGRMYVFTTRADTIMGVTFCAVAPEHPIAIRAAQLNASVSLAVQGFQQGGTTEAELATKEKEGVATGLFVTHPLTGEQIEVWVGNYVLMSYGDGAVMGVPAHDERDFAFALKYALPIKQVVAKQTVHSELVEGVARASTGPARTEFSCTTWQDWYADKDGTTSMNSDKYDGLSRLDCVNSVAADLAAKGLGEKKTTWRLRDWGVSRQRYWGTPIPIIHCDGAGDAASACGAVPVPEKDLPVVLPTDLVPDGSGNPLNKSAKFLNVACPTCGKPAKRETDTMDTFVDSSWYYSRYCDPTNTDAMVAGGAAYWMGTNAAPASPTNRGGGMDQYIGGIEHAILHLLYARFWTKVMRDLGLLQVDEPFKKLLCQGMVLNHVYSRKNAGGSIDYFWPTDVEHTFDVDGKINGAKLKSDGSAVDYGGVTTMSKSKNNGVDPQDIIDRYGADTARLYMMFTAPPEATLEWNDAAVEGSYRFLRRVWNFAQAKASIVQATLDKGCWQVVTYSKAGKELRRETYLILKQANFDYERMQYNTVVSACMKMLNTLESAKLEDDYNDRAVLTECISVLLRILYPACPHLCFELWGQLGFSSKAGDLLDTAWPQVDESALVQDELELMLQINGKLRGSITVPASADKATIEAAALASDAFVKQAAGAAPKKVIVVPGRLINIVI